MTPHGLAQRIHDELAEDYPVLCDPRGDHPDPSDDPGFHVAMKAHDMCVGHGAACDGMDGEEVGFSDGMAMFRGGSTKSPAKSGHAPSAKTGGCGSGAGGFKAGNTCGHKGNRNQKVEAARAAHTAAKADVLTHVKAHRNATKAAAKSGESAPHPGDLHAAIKHAAKKHGELTAARDTHRDEQRQRRNVAARERRAIAGGKAQPLSAKPKAPSREGQARPPSTDKGPASSRKGVVAARHQMVARNLRRRAADLHKQAGALDDDGPRQSVRGVGAESHGPGGRAKGSAVGAIHRPVRREPSAESAALRSQASALGRRADVHEKRAARLQGFERPGAKRPEGFEEAVRAEMARRKAGDSYALSPQSARVRGNGADAFHNTGRGHGGRAPLLGLQDLPTNSARGQGSLFGPKMHDPNAGISGTTGRSVVVDEHGQHRLPGDFRTTARAPKGQTEDRIRHALARNNAIREKIDERSASLVRARDDARKTLRELHESNPVNPDPRSHSDRVANEKALADRGRKIRKAFEDVRKAELAAIPATARVNRIASRGDRLVKALRESLERGATRNFSDFDHIANEVSSSLATFRVAGGMRAPAKAPSKAGKPGGCGTGAGGFKAGNTCGARNQRNGKVEEARVAHVAAKREVLAHVKAHRAASKKAAKSGDTAPAPKELHAAIKKAAKAHGELKTARETHKANRRQERNTAARERRASDKRAAAEKDARAVQALKKARDKLRQARTRPAPVTRDPSTHDDHAPGHVGMLKTDLIHADPHRFQYKESLNEAGSVGSLAGVKKYDHNLGGVVQVWKDPKDNKTYVVNGHNRLELAKKLGADKITVRYLDAKDHKEARSIGALTNIAEGRGTAVDAAKYFRDTGLTREQIADKGIPLREKIATDGIALSHLDKSVFDKVTSGHITPERGAIIGGAGLDHHEQKALVTMLDKHKGREITNAHLKELADEVKSARSVRQKTTDLFGSHEDDHSLALHKTKLQATIKERLGKEKRLFGIVAKSRHAEELGRAGNQINTHESAKISDNAATTLGVFDSLKNRSGPVAKTLNDAAERIHKGENVKKVTDETYRSILKDLPAMLHGGNAFAP